MQPSSQRDSSYLGEGDARVFQVAKEEALCCPSAKQQLDKERGVSVKEGEHGKKICVIC